MVTKTETENKVKETAAIASDTDMQIMEDTVPGGETIPLQPSSSESAPQQFVSEQPSMIIESAPEGVPALTLHHQYEQEPQEIRTDIEAPREMNGQTVFFDDDHHQWWTTTWKTSDNRSNCHCLPRRNTAFGQEK